MKQQISSIHRINGFGKIIDNAVEVKYLGAIPGMKFMMDECCTLPWEDDNIKNAIDFYKRCGLPIGQSDKFLLKMATKYGYTIVTEDRGLIISAFHKKIPIIYRLEDRRLFLIE